MDDPTMSFIHKNICVLVSTQQKYVLRMFWIMFLLSYENIISECSQIFQSIQFFVLNSFFFYVNIRENIKVMVNFIILQTL